MPKQQQQQQLEDGWVHVVKGKKMDAPPTSNEPAKDATVEQLTSDFEKKMKVWRDSSCRTQLHKILDREQPDDGWPITKALCLGTGSFSRDNWECQRRTMRQFVAFIDTVQYLQTKTAQTIDIFAQDPNYNALDKAFLSSINVEMLDITRFQAQSGGLHLAEEHLGPATLVFELFIEVIAKTLRPLCRSGIPLYVGSSLSGWLPGGNIRERRHMMGPDRQEQFDLAEEFRAIHRSFQFPHFEEDPLCVEGLMLHLPKLRDPDEDDE